MGSGRLGVWSRGNSCNVVRLTEKRPHECFVVVPQVGRFAISSQKVERRWTHARCLGLVCYHSMNFKFTDLQSKRRKIRYLHIVSRNISLHSEGLTNTKSKRTIRTEHLSSAKQSGFTIQLLKANRADRAAELRSSPKWELHP